MVVSVSGPFLRVQDDEPGRLTTANPRWPEGPASAKKQRRGGGGPLGTSEPVMSDPDSTQPHDCEGKKTRRGLGISLTGRVACGGGGNLYLGLKPISDAYAGFKYRSFGGVF